MLPPRVSLVDVGPRDGLQNEAGAVSAAHKIELVARLQAAGLKAIEVTSFVSPKWVPQMADAAEVLAGIARPPGVVHSVLVPNMKGLQSVLALPHAQRPDEIVVFGAASEAFSQRNIHCGIDESIARFAPVVEAARAAGLQVRGSISCALGCPYEGEIAPARVSRVAGLMRGIGVEHVGVADTIGVGTPERVRRAMAAALEHFSPDRISGHFHDTYGQALANVYACLPMGVSVFDASVGGLGGCPYAIGATGNVATEDIVFMLQGLGIDCGIDLDALVDAAAFICGVLGRKPVSRVANAVLARRKAATSPTTPAATAA